MLADFLTPTDCGADLKVLHIFLHAHTFTVTQKYPRGDRNRSVVILRRPELQ